MSQPEKKQWVLVSNIWDDANPQDLEKIVPPVAALVESGNLREK